MAMTAGRAHRVVLAGGGTGGHVTPALALGEEFSARGDAVLFLGSERGLERRLVPAAGFELVALPARPLARGGWAARAAAAAALTRATAGALACLRRFRAELVVSVGGYAGAPAAAAAALTRVPLAVVEPNAVPGRANRLASRFARRVFIAFDATAERLSAASRRGVVEVSGVPLRRALREATHGAPRRSPEPPFRLLVFGGSQGARQLNDAMCDALPRLDPAQLQVVHQSGAADRERVAEAYARAGVHADVVDFEPDMPARYAWADLALCRSGALTVAELALAGLPALLVPYPYAADDHQRANARELERAGAARVLDPRALDGAGLAKTLVEIFENRVGLAAMARAAAGRARPEATARIVEACRTLLES